MLRGQGETTNIDTAQPIAVGDVVRFTGYGAPSYAYARRVLRVGMPYGVAGVSEWDGTTWLRLRGTGGLQFNACMFEKGA